MLQRYGDDPNLFERCFGALDFVRNENPAVPNLTENEGNGERTGTVSRLDIQFHWWSALAVHTLDKPWLIG